MTIQAYSWEVDLLEKAQATAHNAIGHAQRSLRTIEEAFSSHIDQPLLQRAYDDCDRLTYQNSHTFYLASNMLPVEKRRAVRALYAFCRTTDDLVDRVVIEPERALDAWRQQVLAPQPASDSPNRLIALAWEDARRRFGVPILYAEQLIEGVSADFGCVRYQNFTDLAQYCYGVASTVGLMSMHIIGFSGPGALPYAIRLGVALQLTNILRDIGEDWRNGRLYLPLDELGSFNLTEADIQAGQVDDRWRGLMRFQIQRARRLYAEALPGIYELNPEGRFAIAAAARLYEAILADIEAHDYDVFTRRAHLSGWAKFRLLPSIWLEAIKEQKK